MWDVDVHKIRQRQRYEYLRREAEQYRLAQELGFTAADTLRAWASRLRGWLVEFRHMLHQRFVERRQIMDDFDAKNHLRDLHREADNERIAQLVEAESETKKPKVAQRSLFAVAVRLLAWMFAQTRRAGG